MQWQLEAHLDFIILKVLVLIYILVCYISGIGCDAAAIVNILAHRDATQRSRIQQEYETTYSDELRKRLSSELTGYLRVIFSMGRNYSHFSV